MNSIFTFFDKLIDMILKARTLQLICFLFTTFIVILIKWDHTFLEPYVGWFASCGAFCFTLLFCDGLKKIINWFKFRRVSRKRNTVDSHQ